MASSTLVTNVSLSKYRKYKFMIVFFVLKKSGKRDSNPRPRPWQGRALPTELLPPDNKTNDVKRRRLELPRNNFHYPLKVARLPIPPPLQHKNRTRTRDLDLGKVALYQLSYCRLYPFSKEHFSKCGAKIRLFLKPAKLSDCFFHFSSKFLLFHLKTCSFYILDTYNINLHDK